MKKMICAILVTAVVVSPAAAQKKKQDNPVFTDPSKTGIDFDMQGEYLTGKDLKSPWGAEVIGKGNGAFVINVLPGGLRGEGGDFKKRIEGVGKSSGNRIEIKFKTKGYEGGVTRAAFRRGDKPQSSMALNLPDGRTLVLAKVTRKSKTLGMELPKDAVVLFNGKDKNEKEWKNGKMEMGNLLGNGANSKKEFRDHKVHLEFRLSYMPTRGGQGRSNSGVYLQHRYEVQVLDSFGLHGKSNECGGIYSIATPKVNMCYPPLQWQTYDIDFKAARFDEKGKKTANAVISVWHNGVLIHDKVELTKNTGGGRPETAAPGPLYLQGHGGQVQYRNIWAVETGKK